MSHRGLFYIARSMGFLKKDLSQFDIVVNDDTAKTFETKRENPIQIR